jgi:hypothetical protein
MQETEDSWVPKAAATTIGLILYVIAFLIAPCVASLLSITPSDSPSRSISSVSNHSRRASSRRDVIFLYGTALTSGVALALRSLNATGCRARVVFFMSPTVRLTDETSTFLSGLNVETVSDCGPRDSQRSVVPHMTRFHHEYEWLTAHQGEVDRVLHSDAYDIFFQSDPFVDAISPAYLMFVVEPHFIRHCGWNLHWFEDCFGENLEHFKNSFIICSGSIAGNAVFYQKLVELMLNTPQWKSCYSSSKDQPILNWLVWSGKVKEAGIKYRFVGCDGGLMTIQWCVLNQEVKYNENGDILSPLHTVPAYLHQYTRLDGLQRYLMKRIGM